jgi:chemotaxis regulatin CheY-phosphate phosphatase CheZ
MSGYEANYPDPNLGFESIEAAVMETERGRAFLREYAKRNRHADTQVLLTSLSRIEKSIEMRQEPSGVDQFRGDLLEMASAIDKARKEISAIHSDQENANPLNSASGELDQIVLETEAATSDILAAAEKIQETAFTMREAGGNSSLCDLIDEQATLIYMASSFQDLTAQRTRKVIDALGFLEKRILAMVDIWAFAPKADESGANGEVSSQPNHNGNLLSQADIDFVLVEDEKQKQALIEGPIQNHSSQDHSTTAAALSAQEAFHDLAQPKARIAAALASKEEVSSSAVEADAPHENETEIDELLFSREAALAAVSQPQVSNSPVLNTRDMLRVVENPQKIEETLHRAKAGIALTPSEAEQALDALKGMSVEERTLLFS